MNPNLERYIDDHLAGSAGAVNLISAIAAASDNLDQRAFFEDLHAKVEDDRTTLKNLLQLAGSSDSQALQIAGSMAEKATRLKFMWEGLEPGKLGMFEALEVLCLGIQGKCLLWRMFGEISASLPAWSEYDFIALEQEAVQQRDSVEAYRLRAGVEALAA